MDTAALIIFRFIASTVWTADRAIVNIREALKNKVKQINTV